MTTVSNSNGNGRVREIPRFPAANIDQDFGPELPLALQRPIFNWLFIRAGVVEVDKNSERVASLMRGEIIEARDAHNSGKTSHLISEVGDIRFYFGSFYFGQLLSNGGKISELNTHWIHAQSLITKPGSGVYDRLEEISGDLEMGGEKSLPALEEMHIQLLALWRELSFLGAPMAVMDWVANVKNTKNLVAEAVNGLDPFTGKPLLPHERKEQHVHAVAAFKLLRDFDGRRKDGLSDHLYRENRLQVLNFRDSEVVLNKLKQKLALAAGNGHLNGVR